MIQTDQEARGDEQRVGKFHNRKATQIAGVDQVREDAEEGKPDREPVEDQEQKLNCDDAIYQTAQ